MPTARGDVWRFTNAGFPEFMVADAARAGLYFVTPPARTRPARTEAPAQFWCAT
jgi:hypothetical protein